MKLAIDTDAGTIDIDGRRGDLFSQESFAALSDIWTRVGWGRKYSYGFSWLGVPIIQLPEDMVRYQEAIFALQPDIIIETGVAHGGSAIFCAGLCRLMGKGRVIAIDIEIRPHNRARIKNHPLAELITLIDGSSIAPEVVSQVKAVIAPGDKVLVMLDSNHTYEHVMAELEAYAPLVTPGSYIVAADGIAKDVAHAPGGRPEWVDDNPARAARDFAAKHSEFILSTPHRPFDETRSTPDITYWPDAWLRRLG